MIGNLKSFEKSHLLDLLRSDNVWETLDIDYHPPFVKRLWIQLDEDYRLYLHEIHPCKTEEALLHPHAWQSAMHVLPIGGVYEHGMGHRMPYWDIVSMGYGLPKDVIISTQEVHSEMYYEMIDKNAIHYVRPLNGPVYTVMLAGPVMWPENNHKADKKLESLSDSDKSRLLNIFRNYFKINL